MFNLFSRPTSYVESQPVGPMTDDERQRMSALEAERTLAFDKFYRVGRLNEPSLVLDNFLFLGNIQHATNRDVLVRFDIKHILNVCDLTLGALILENFNVIHIPMPDEPRTNIKKHFDRTNELLREFQQKNERCLVHCAAGVSRSATIVLAYLMKFHHNTLRDAFFYLMEKRPQIWPNEGFLLQLLRYESELVPTGEPKGENPLQTLTEFEAKESISLE